MNDGVFQEDITNEVAQTLIGKDAYRANCKYQLVTTEFGMYVLRIDDDAPEDMRYAEIPIEDTNDEVLSFNDMLYSQPTLSTAAIQQSNAKPKFTIDTFALVKALVYFLLLLGIALIVCVLLLF